MGSPAASTGIKAATHAYESWLHDSLPVVVDDDLEFKHQQMTLGVFPFLRATFYRWAARWVALCPHLAEAPPVLGIGDLHVENYGTWRDTEGRLVWGINDFDEATELPYTADLVRLATSATLAAAADRLRIGSADAAAAALAGYQEGLQHGGRPVILAEHHAELRRLASGELRDPVRFWAKLDSLGDADLSAYPPEASRLAIAALPADPVGTADGSQARIHPRRAGLGSLGRPRLVAVGPWQGAKVAREVKSLLPSAYDWALGNAETPVRYQDIVERAVRDPDPGTAVHERWLVRRLAPDCARIELADLPAERDETALLHSMGFELANVHLGTPAAIPAVLQDLASRSGRHPHWLSEAADRMAADTDNDWNDWRR